MALCLGLAPRAGRAQAPTAQGAAPNDAAEQIVVTGTRTPERSQRATVKTDVVTREEAERRGATNVAEALSTQPGVQVNPGAYGYLGGVSAVQIQGFDRDRVLILEDGERIVGDVGGAIDLAALPTGDLARIEIVTGPTSSLYGSSAIGGVVNIITQPPRLTGPSGRFRMEARNPWGYVLQGNAAYRRPADDGRRGLIHSEWAGVDLNAVQSPGIARTPDLPDLSLPSAFRGMLGLRGGVAVGERVSLRLRLRAFRDHVQGLESRIVPGLGRFITDLPETTNRYTAHLIEEIKLTDKATLRVTLGHQQTLNETVKDRRDSPLDEVRSRHHRMQSVETIATLADGRRTWVLGTRAEAEHFSQDKSVTESVGTGTVTTDSREVVPQGIGNGAVYGQMQWKLTDRFTVLPGVRFEGNTRYGTALSPRLAGSYRLGEHVMLRASGGRGFRAPSAKELGFVFDHSFYGYRIAGNPQLLPETSWGTNADVTWSPGKRFTGRVGAYANWVNEMIDLDIANGTPSAGGVVNYSYTNFGKARTLGGQVDLQMQLHDRVRLESSYAYLWTRDDQSGQPLSGRPPHTITNSLRVLLPADIELYARHRLVTSAPLGASDPSLTGTQGLTDSPGFATFDVRVGRELWKQSQLYAGALNLFDVHQEPGRIGDMRPPQGRIIYVGLRSEFPWEDSSP